MGNQKNKRVSKKKRVAKEEKVRLPDLYQRRIHGTDEWIYMLDDVECSKAEYDKVDALWTIEVNRDQYECDKRAEKAEKARKVARSWFLK